jgi:glycosyltransferase involved in cell wall biosynthesis
MKILLIHQYFLEKGEGGGSRFNEMTQIWASQGHKITVLAGMVHYGTGLKPIKYEGKFICVENSFYKNVDVVRCYVSESYNTNFLGRLWAYFSFVFSSICGGLFEKHGKYDVIVVTSPPLFVCITALVLSRVRGVPLVLEVRDLWPESAIDTGVLKSRTLINLSFWFERLVYKKAKLINVLTPAFREILINEKKVPGEKVIYIPNAADFSLAEQVSKDFNASDFRNELGLDGKFVITYVGAHGVANHLIQLINAAEKLSDSNVVFMLIGDGMMKEELVQEVMNRNLNNVIFKDSVSKLDIYKYILASDVGASVLKNVDTFKTVYSNKTFDYMSCKKPILLAIDGVSRELINAARCGVYVEPENTTAIVSGVLDLLKKEKKELIEMGISGYIFAKEYFDREKLAKYYISKIEEII